MKRPKGDLPGMIAAYGGLLPEDAPLLEDILSRLDEADPAARRRVWNSIDKLLMA